MQTEAWGRVWMYTMAPVELRENPTPQFLASFLFTALPPVYGSAGPGLRSWRQHAELCSLSYFLE